MDKPERTTPTKPIAPDVSIRLQTIVLAEGIDAVAERSGVSPKTIQRALAGLPILRMSSRALVAILEKPRAA